MSVRTGIVVVSHSARLAEGLVEVAAQMAPDVALRAAGGTDEGGIGTSFAKVEAAVEELAGAGEVVVVTDLGSATMTAESVLETLDDATAVLADGPLVEGTVAGAVAAQGGADAAAVARAVGEAAGSFRAAGTAGAPDGGGAGDADTAGSGADGGAVGDSDTGAGGSGAGAEDTDADTEDRAAGDGTAVEATLRLTNKVGLHARPAALLARLVGGFDAEVTVNDVDADSVLALMGLGLEQGDEMRVRASGAEAAQAVSAVRQAVAEGFGEE
ncbi:HPr family phosphocarrier protein [Georgenia sp. TF02-10]|uniref:dihydroxyacetone kinase phosphoryl donor subunit DhaM n=1 Tax=Georgenia sp. TF02-10 TaxID=2917725 RepID=UPI001FA71D47|nr:dihydroxyacetone kinase phosphoryl donor subunit DhaM [Georgenia sp. TF02-10]UNX55879.1 HPr family phosphocarrier protein [Georgenia sp. TF02-10]